VSIDGGAVTTIAAVPTRVAGGISWGADGAIIFGIPLFRVPASGGTLEDLHQPGQAPQALPGGAVLFTEMTPGQPSRASVRLPDGRVRELVRNAMNPRYVAPGYLVYAERNTLFAVRFDLKTYDVSGSPVQVMDDEVQGVAQAWSAFSVSGNGSLAYIPGAMATLSAGRVPVWIDRADGHETVWPLPARPYTDVLVSPDDTMLLTMLFEDATPTGRAGDARPNQARGAKAAATDAQRRLWVGDSNKKTLVKVTNVAPTSFAWWSDSKRVIYANPDGSLARCTADGSTPEETVQPAGSVFILPGQMHVAPDGRAVVWAGRKPGDANGRSVMWMWSPIDGAASGGGSGTIQTVFAPPAGNITVPRFSPDGRWIAFILTRQGRPALTLRPVSGQGPMIEVSADTNGGAPEWHGRQLVWRRAGEAGVDVMAADIAPGPRPVIGTPQVLYTIATFAPNPTVVGQLSADAKRLVATRPDRPDAPAQINLILNWVEELKQRFAAARGK